MIVAELLARLGINIDPGSMKTANDFIDKLHRGVVDLAANKAWNTIAGAFEKTTHQATMLVEESLKTGASINTLQELGYAAEASGSSLGEVTTGFRMISRYSKQAADGSATNRKELKKVGIDYKKLADGTMTLDEAYLKIGDSIKKMPTAAGKSAQAMKFLGRAGANQIPFFEEGAEKINELRKEAHEFGNVMDEQTVRGFKAYGDELGHLHARFDGLKTQIAVAVLPVMTELLEKVQKWIGKNRELIAQRLKQMLEGLVWAMEKFVRIVDKVLEGLDWMADNFETVKLAAVALTAAMIILQAKGELAAFATARAWLAATAPVIAVGVAVAGVALAVEDLWTWSQGGVSVFEQMYDQAKKWLGDKLKEIIVGANEMIDNFFNPKDDNGTLTGTVGAAVGDLLDGGSVGDGMRRQQAFKADVGGAYTTMANAQELYKSGKIGEAGQNLTQLGSNYYDDYKKQDSIATQKSFEYVLSRIKTGMYGGKFGDMAEQRSMGINERSLGLTDLANKQYGVLKAADSIAINVAVSPGDKAIGDKVGEAVKKAMTGWWEDVMTSAQSGTGSGGTP